MNAIHPSFEAAMALCRAGFNVIPIRPNDKLPTGKWSHLVGKIQTANEASTLFRPYALDGCNIAALGGTRSAYGRRPVAPIDVDDGARIDDVIRATRRACEAMPGIVETGLGFRVIVKTEWPAAVTIHDGKYGEVRGLGAYAVMPPSIHPNGKQYAWMREPERIPVIKHPHYLLDIGIHISPAYEIGDGMLAGVNIGAPAMLNRHDFQRLPRLAQAILNNVPQAISRYPSRSEVDFALFVSLAGHGLTRDEVAAYALITKHDASYLTDKAGIARRDTLKRIYYGIDKALEVIKRCTPEYAHAQMHAQECRLYAWSVAWHRLNGSLGETRRAAYLAHADTVSHAGKTDNYHLSIRDGATLAAMSHRAYTNANKANITAGIIITTRQHTAHTAHATRYTLPPPPPLQTAPQITLHASSASQRTPIEASTTNSHGDSHASMALPVYVEEWIHLNNTPNDAFEHSGLGRSAKAVYMALLTGCNGTQRELSAFTGLSQPTVSRALARLELHDMAMFDGNVWHAIKRDAEWLQALAKRLGTHGRGKRRAIENESAQRAYRDMLANKRRR